ncbi:hypothetical protein AB2B41_16410 [Marimonas sp. MJW-29]|uniref:PH domain-containing protein n=1 Tax=Sulfitobacter sediminis TaxID=3234186 RepID=A0ABV3RQG2_9RHOB
MEPVLVRINRRRCVLLETLLAAIAVFVLCLVAFPLSIGIFDWLIAAGLLTAAFFGWFALYFFALARRNAVALRMDDKGISGYYVDPVSWADIAEVRAFQDSRRNGFLGFALKDPVAFRDRQTPWRRLRSWSLGRQNGVHQVVPEMVLADVTVVELAETARHFLATHRP